MVAEEALDGAELDLVAERRRGAVGIDVIDILGIEAGAREGRRHGAVGAIAVLGGGRDVVGVAREPVADDLGMDPGPPALRVLQLLEHDDAGPPPP